MNYIFILLLTLVSLPSQAEVSKLNLELKKMPFQRDYYIPEHTSWDYEVTLNMDLKLNTINYGYQSFLFLESDLTGQSRNSRFRNMWWDYTLGFSLLPDIDIIWDHRSQHSLDEQVDYVNDKYPVTDSYGIRINFLKRFK